MNSKEASEILLRYKAGTATEEEKAWVESWYVRFKDRVSEVAGDQIAADQAESWAIFEKEYTAVGSRADKTKVTRLWSRVAVAAAAVAAITLGVWIYYTPSSRQSEATRDLYANDIAPGKNTATLTLANGKTINLSDAKTGVVIGENDMSYNDGSIVVDPSSRTEGRELSSGGKDLSVLRDDEVITASTPRGGTYQVTLPDGTKVWLNAESKLVFPSKFMNGKTRNVRLVGEGYFEVATSYTSVRGRRTKQSFIVESEGQRVEVLGTHFNINSYGDEGSAKTTLVEGSVRVSQAVRHAEFISASRSSKANIQGSNDDAGALKQVQGDDRASKVAKSIIVKPNQQATLSDDKLSVQEVDIKQAIAWKEGDFIFRQEPLESIMKQVARWYNVEVTYKTDVSKHRFDGMVSRSKNISSVLKMIELTGKVHFKVEGRRITVID